MEKSVVLKDIFQLALTDDTIPFVKENKLREKIIKGEYEILKDLSLWDMFQFDKNQCSRLIRDFKDEISLKKFESENVNRKL